MQPLTSKNAPGRFSRGDAAAGTWIYNEFKPYVFTLVSSMTEDSADKADLVHDIFAKLFEFQGRFTNRESVRSLLNQIGVNTCLNYLKRKENRGKRTTELKDDSIGFDEDAIFKAEANATMHDLIWRSIQKFPDKKRAFFLMFYRDDLSNAEIAKRLGISVQTVANKKAMILQTLKMDIGKLAGKEIYELSLLLLIIFYETL